MDKSSNSRSKLAGNSQSTVDLASPELTLPLLSRWQETPWFQFLSRKISMLQSLAANIVEKYCLAPLIPTVRETMLLAIYPLILTFGSFFAVVNPTLRAIPFSTEIQSYPAHAAPCYFARKTNLFNVYYVKIGWLWIGIADICLVITLTWIKKQSLVSKSNTTKSIDDVSTCVDAREDHNSLPSHHRTRLKVLARWLLATTVWYTCTQACFGPALFDRIFTASGGHCKPSPSTTIENIYANGSPPTQSTTVHLPSFSANDRSSCHGAGGIWRGGLDISGHAFILTLGSALLLFEILPVIYPDFLSAAYRSYPCQRPHHACRHRHRRSSDPPSPLFNVPANHQLYAPGIIVKFTLANILICLWMTLMTAIFFHTWIEKFSGTLYALLTVWFIYFFPRQFSHLRTIIGLPGIDC